MHVHRGVSPVRAHLERANRIEKGTLVERSVSRMALEHFKELIDTDFVEARLLGDGAKLLRIGLGEVHRKEAVAHGRHWRSARLIRQRWER